MKLSDFSISAKQDSKRLLEQIEAFNQTRTEYPRHKTIHQVFTEQAARNPDAVAILFGSGQLTYGELERRSNQIARFLLDLGLGHEAAVGIMLDRSPEAVVAMLGILKAGGAYVPISPDLPFQRIRYMLTETQAPVLVSERAYIKTLNKLQWECAHLTNILCIDSMNIHAEIEEAGGLMAPEIWRYVADEAFDDISGGGWKSSYTGDWLSREVMDDYGDNIRAKLAPFLSKSTRVLEVGCASGISMFRIAPLVGTYHGTDISAGIIDWCRSESASKNLDNIELSCLAAHEVDRLSTEPFDVVILNSVIECFSGHNYLRDVLRKALDLMADESLLFLGNVWDQDRKDRFVQSLCEFKKQNQGKGFRTKTEREEELYISKSFLEDLGKDFPEIASIECSDLLGASESELSLYSFDAIIRIDKRGRATERPRHKYQYDQRALRAHTEEPVGEHTSAKGLAYLIYTSGSSGVPKGVMVEHRAILRLVLQTNYVVLDPSTRVLQTGAMSFDASTFEIWGPLLNGGATCLPVGNDLLDARQLGRYIKSHGITTMFLTTGLFNQLVEADIGIFAGLGQLLSGGEKVSVRHFNALRGAYPALALKHVYGPTENTTFSTCFDVERSYPRDIPIGKPISNTTAYILDKELRLAPIGVPGELCVGGEGLARGYLGDPALTEAKFIPHPFAPGQRLYRTGDRARWSADGNIEFLGRIDNQIKLSGYRVEPGEIEIQLRKHPAVREAVVVARDLGAGKELVAYVTGVDMNHDDLRAHLALTLPDYMVPSHFVTMERLPLAPTGKVDQAALPQPERLRLASNDGYVPPENEIQHKLVAIWEEVLGNRGIGITDNFFDLGGHSLKVIKLISIIQRQMQVEMPLIIMFKTPTIRELANYISDYRKLRAQGIELDKTDETMLCLSASTAGPPVLAFPPGSGYALAYSALVEPLASYTLYGFNFLESENGLEHYGQLIMKQALTVPPILFGFSGGGKLAYQIAVYLEKQGIPIAGLVLLDSARYTQPITFDDSGLAEAASDFLAGMTSQALREKIYQKMKAFRTYLGSCVETEILNTGIDLILEEGAPEYFYDDAGKVVGGTRLWGELTRSAFNIHQGAGKHRDMLTPPYLQSNTALLRGIFQRLSSPAR